MFISLQGMDVLRFCNHRWLIVVVLVHKSVDHFSVVSSVILCQMQQANMATVQDNVHNLTHPSERDEFKKNQRPSSWTSTHTCLCN